MKIEEEQSYIVVGKAVNGIRGMKLYFAVKEGKYSWSTKSYQAYPFKSEMEAKNRINRLSLKKLVSTVYGVEIIKKEYQIIKALNTYI